MDPHFVLRREVDRLGILANSIYDIYRWGSGHRQLVRENAFFVRDRLQQDAILDEYQRQELEEISNLNRNIDISGNDLDHIYDCIVYYDDGKLNEDKFRKGISQFSIRQFANELWHDMSNCKVHITKEVFRRIFRSCRINSLLSHPSAVPQSDITGSYMYYQKDGTISEETTTDYRKLVKMLNQSLIDGSPSYVLGFRFFHLEGVSDELVQLIGAVMNLDLDTILDILHNISSAECDVNEEYVYWSLPWLRVCESSSIGGEQSLARSMLHVLLFTRQNILITLRHKEVFQLSSLMETEVQTSLDMMSVLSAIRRFHSRYHSNIAVLLYLFDLHVDRMVSIVIRVVQSLYRVEDKIILNDSASLYKRHENISLEKVSNCYQMLQKILSDEEAFSSLLGGVKDALDGMKDTYFDEFRRSEMNYNMRDITDHLTTTKWYVEEGMKICDDLNSKAEILAKGRHSKLLYIVTAFQTIFLPLQTITAIYGMNFDEFPELSFHYSYHIFWVFSVIFATIAWVILLR